MITMALICGYPLCRGFWESSVKSYEMGRVNWDVLIYMRRLFFFSAMMVGTTSRFCIWMRTPIGAHYCNRYVGTLIPPLKPTYNANLYRCAPRLGGLWSLTTCAALHDQPRLWQLSVGDLTRSPKALPVPTPLRSLLTSHLSPVLST